MGQRTGYPRPQRKKNAQNSTFFKSGVQCLSVLSGNNHSPHWLRQNLPMSWAIFSISIQRTSLLPLAVTPCSSYQNRATCFPDKALAFGKAVRPASKYIFCTHFTHKSSTGRFSWENITFSDRASSKVASAVSVLLESVCSDFTLSFRLVSCLSLSLSCSCRFSICK